MTSGVPMIDFKPISELGDVYNKARREAVREQSLADLGTSQPFDYEQAARALLASGDVQGAVALARIAAATRGQAYRALPHVPYPQVPQPQATHSQVTPPSASAPSSPDWSNMNAAPNWSLPKDLNLLPYGYYLPGGDR
jgi:hypothetical protein